MFKNALVSVSDKTGLAEFLAPFVKQGLRLVSTGGTAEYLKSSGFKVVDIQDQTGFPEVMGGRVKTLHPRVHMPLLARASEPGDFELLKKEGLEPFDLLIVNLYPFEKTYRQRAELPEDELIEKIDIGGPSLLRAAAKNFSRVSVVVDPQDYAWIKERHEMSWADRRHLAGKVFAHTARYDSLIASWFHETAGKETGMAQPGAPQPGAPQPGAPQPAAPQPAAHNSAVFFSYETSLGGTLVQTLRYGENPHQQAAWYARSGSGNGLHAAQIRQGKELSFNNLLDLEAAAALARQFADQAVAVAVKHNNPCGVAVGRNLAEALPKALQADPVSVFGGIVVVNREIGPLEAEMLSSIFLECVLAPSVSAPALTIFAKKKNLRVLEWPGLLEEDTSPEVRSVAGGFLAQTPHTFSSRSHQWKTLGAQPGPETLRDLIFAEKVCASLKSNAIAIVKDGQTLGLGMGQVNRVEAVEHAVSRMHAHHKQAGETILASDAFFPFPDSIERAAAAGVKWILQPGGSLRDQEVLDAAGKLGLNMVLTGERHFRH